MFEKHHQKKAEKEYEEGLGRWQAERDGYAELLALAEGFVGNATTEIMLSPGEVLFYKVSGAALVEQRSAKGHWQGGSAGIAVPLGTVHGRSVRYRVGATRGHYVQGSWAPTAVGTGTVYVTNRRWFFAGGANNAGHGRWVLQARAQPSAGGLVALGDQDGHVTVLQRAQTERAVRQFGRVDSHSQCATGAVVHDRICPPRRMDAAPAVARATTGRGHLSSGPRRNARTGASAPIRPGDLGYGSPGARVLPKAGCSAPVVVGGRSSSSQEGLLEISFAVSGRLAMKFHHSAERPVASPVCVGSIRVLLAMVPANDRDARLSAEVFGWKSTDRGGPGHRSGSPCLLGDQFRGPMVHERSAAQ